MTKYRYLLLTLIITLIATSGCQTKSPTAEAENLPEDIVELRADQIKLANIETGLITMRALSGSIRVNGIVTVAPQNYATVCMPLGGFVKSTNLIPGNEVTKGQTLAILENQDIVEIEQNYLETKTKLEYAEAEFKRHTELYKDDVYSTQNMQQVTSEYKTLQAQFKGLEQKLALIGINPDKLNEENISGSVAVVSPISGFITAVNVNIGKYVSPADILFEVVNPKELLIELTLFEKDAHKVAVGESVRFFINNETEQHRALIYQTGKAIQSNNTYKIYATIEGSCPNTLPGMYVNASIETTTLQVTALPSEAIVSFGDKDYIFIFDKNKLEGGKPFTEYKMVEVQKGVSEDGFTHVMLPSGFDITHTKVVFEGAYNLLSAKKNAGEMSCG